MGRWLSWGAWVDRWDRFFFVEVDRHIVALFRVGFAALLLFNFIILGLDLDLFFGPSGVMPIAASRAIIDPSSHTIFELLPDTTTVTWCAYGLAIAHLVCLLLGFFPRVQAVGVFAWTFWFHNRHVMIFDGEDQLFRLFAFFFIFTPSHAHYSVHAWLRERAGKPAIPRYGSVWAIRLFQIQLTIVYAGAAIHKLLGREWWNGTAMWYVTRLDDSFGHMPMPQAPFNSLLVLNLLTWATLLVEPAIAIGLWWSKARRIVLVVALIFHASLWYSMNLFLFQPLMIVGLLSFVATDTGLTPEPRRERTSPPKAATTPKKKPKKKRTPSPTLSRTKTLPPHEVRGDGGVK